MPTVSHKLLFYLKTFYNATVFLKNKYVCVGMNTEIIVNGVDIYNDLKSAYSDCEGGEWESCGSDMGSLVSTLKSSGVLLAQSTSTSGGTFFVEQCLNNCCGTQTRHQLPSITDSEKPNGSAAVNLASTCVLQPKASDFKSSHRRLPESTFPAISSGSGSANTLVAYQTCQSQCGVVDASSDSSSGQSSNAGVIAAAAIGSLAVVGGAALFMKSRQTAGSDGSESLQMVLIEDEVRL